MNRHKVVNTCYFGAILAAFVLSLVHNNKVEASTDPKDYFAYLMESEEDAGSVTIIAEDTEEVGDIVSGESQNNIKEMFDVVDSMVRYKNVEKELSVEKGDTLISLLKRSGVTRDEANKVYYSLKSDFNPSSLRAGQKIKAIFSIDTQDDTAPAELNYMVIEINAGERVVTARNHDKFETFVEQDELIDKTNAVNGVISGNLSSSMQNAGVPMRAVNNFINLFAYAVDFKRDVKKGDKFEIVYESRVNNNDELIKCGKIVYAGLVLRNQKITLYRYEDSNGNVDYYTASGQALKRTLDRKPLAFRNARISSPFGRRLHPILKKRIIHWGVDYAAPQGTAIYAGGDGVVQVAKYNGGYGNYIKIRHNSEYSTAYGHMSKFAKGMRPGVRVTQGQIIGYVGSTGRSTGPHLHYEVIQNGKRVNPRTIKASTGENLSGQSLVKFKQKVEKVNKEYVDAFSGKEVVKVAQK
ncbi:MAG: peptidoglycan DD-metalloendopeptidase family protein [Alphaproteobacteria bacterium]|nr:peptidoglycan DD-metalloendopeptidase family protein [Alphaproteobacteria bacterium]